MKKSILTILLAAAGVLAYGQVSVNYEQFGAKGDGITDDQAAIIAAHDYANTHSLPVRLNAGKVYYIGKGAEHAVIRTDVDFGTARFIIDDRVTDDFRSPVFVVEPENGSIEVEGIESLRKGQGSLGVRLPGRCLVDIVDESTRVYIRYGLNQNNGTARRELVLADADGRILEGTTPVWDYARVTSARAYPIDEKPLTIKGGYFTTIANQAESQYQYRGRGIIIRRSNVLVEGLTHYVEGELDHGAPYSAFIQPDHCAHVTISRCMFTGHRTYTTIGSAGKPVRMGSYDVSAACTIGLRLEHCIQNRSIDDNSYWGVFASNFCKNLVLEDCNFSRFDAHQGVKNVTISNCRLGYMGVQLVGFGTLRIENTEIRRDRMILLRDDYGSSWEGDILIRNCVFRPVGSSIKEVSIIAGTNSGKHDFGYLCSLPGRIEINGLYIDDSAVTDPSYEGPCIFSTFGRDCSQEGLLPYPAEGKIILKGVKVESGKKLSVSRNKALFSGYSIPAAYR